MTAARILPVSILAAVLAVLTLAPSAWSSGWVLWLADVRPVPNNPDMSSFHWNAVTTASTQSDCAVLANAANADLKQSQPTANARYTCFPVTVDPRGPSLE